MQRLDKTLITRNSKGKIRVVEAHCEWCQDKMGFVIHRLSYQYKGKKTPQPDLLIQKGKAKRTVTEQARLEFDSLVNKWRDKGYKELSKSIDDYTEEELNNILPEDITDDNGMLKPMLAKDYNKASASILEHKWYASRKIDGVRCLMYYKDGEVHTASRGGKNYDSSLEHITQHPDVINFFQENPEIILDGEIYIHRVSLQSISGLVRLDVNVNNICKELQYWIYDIVDPKMKFSDRLKVLEELVTLSFEHSTANIVMVEHVPCEGWLQIKALHDKYVAEGFEGVVIRNPNKPYGVNKRSNDMLKIKNYKEAEFIITGISEGLRDEDMCFVCETEDGIEFKAKPMGSRELKQEYRENIDSIIGKMATVKYFYLSDDGTPLQPVLKAIRDYE